MTKANEMDNERTRKLLDVDGVWGTLTRMSWLLSPPIMVLLVGFLVWTTRTIQTHESRFAAMDEWKDSRVADLKTLSDRTSAQDMQIENIRKTIEIKALNDTKMFTEISVKLDMLMDVLRQHMDNTARGKGVGSIPP